MSQHFGLQQIFGAIDDVDSFVFRAEVVVEGTDVRVFLALEP